MNPIVIIGAAAAVLLLGGKKKGGSSSGGGSGSSNGNSGSGGGFEGIRRMSYKLPGGGVSKTPGSRCSMSGGLGAWSSKGKCEKFWDFGSTPDLVRNKALDIMKSRSPAHMEEMRGEVIDVYRDGYHHGPWVVGPGGGGIAVSEDILAQAGAVGPVPVPKKYLALVEEVVKSLWPNLKNESLADLGVTTMSYIRSPSDNYEVWVTENRGGSAGDTFSDPDPNQSSYMKKKIFALASSIIPDVVMHGEVLDPII